MNTNTFLLILNVNFTSTADVFLAGYDPHD